MTPASIRYKNPGAMWGNAIAIKWGADKHPVNLNDGKGQGNNIAVFPTYVQGICAQLDLWRSRPQYKNKTFGEAIDVWSGHNEVESYIAFVSKRVPGLTRDTVLNDAFWAGPMGIPFLKAQAWHEAGQEYPASEEDWIKARNIVFGRAPKVAAKVAVGTGAVVVASQQAVQYGVEPWFIIVVAVAALVSLGFWIYQSHFKKG